MTPHQCLQSSHDMETFLAHEPELDFLLRPSSINPSEILLRTNHNTPMLWPMTQEYCAIFNMAVAEYLFHELWNITLIPYGLHQDPDHWARLALDAIKLSKVAPFQPIQQRVGRYVVTSRYVPFVHPLSHGISGTGSGAHATFHVKRPQEN